MTDVANMQDQLSYSTGSSNSSGSSSSNSNLPSWYLGAGKNAANYYNRGLANLPTTGYQGDRYASIGPLQSAGIAQGDNYLNASSPLYAQGAGLIGQGASSISGAGNWQEPEMMRHMNPYTTGALSAMADLANRNLTENVIPGINSTFTGAGQFGSSRNADFMNRAIRDNQQVIAQQGANMLNSAYGQASDDYYRWAQQQLASGTALGGLGQSMGQYGITGLNTGMNLGQVAQKDQQGALDAAMAAWKDNQTFPIELYNLLGTGMGNALSRLTPEQNSSSSNSSSQSQSSYNLGSSLTI